MKVTKTDSAKGVSTSRKANKTAGGDSGFADALRDVSGPEATGPAQTTSGVGAVSAILAMQQTADATDHRSRGLMMEYGNDLLYQLDKISMAILGGAISKDRLQDIARRLRERKITSDDPKLNDLIDEVELRVEVEIAKLTR